MIPKSFSASAFQVAETCMARYHAENVLRTERPPNLAADLGTAVHAALEWYVKTVYIDQTKPASLQALLTLYRLHFMVVFETVDPENHEWYAEGADMLKVWFARTDFSNRKVLSTEVKTQFDINTSAGPIPFNYIWDRFDQFTDRVDEFEVVDYKTIRKALNPNDLRKKIQARFYGLAAQIQHPEANRIWVRFDLLRHDSVATVFTKEDNKATWLFAKALAERIIATSPVDITETLNAECNFCVRKAACKALMSNVAGGGILSLATTEQRIDTRARLEFQRKGLDTLISDLDEILLQEAAEQEALELANDNYVLKVTQGFRRGVDAERVQHLVPEYLFNKYGGIQLTMANFGKLLKDKELEPAVKKQLEALVYRTAGSLSLKVEARNPIGDE